MIQGLKTDDLANRVGGRFKLTALIQRRLIELMQGARPMVETKGLTDIEVVIKELMDEKIAIRDTESDDSEDDDADEKAGL